jgi:glycerol-3-phosphate dehydrogenase
LNRVQTDGVAPGEPFDLLIVGGGINGAGIARDAAGRGLKVLLVEQDDLAAHTSSASTKLIHGGLRYLEQGRFRLVRESLMERERLLRIAPHLISPLQFVVPQSESPRPAWLVRFGLMIYDRLGGPSALPRTQNVRLADHSFGSGLRGRRGSAFVYSDCRVPDSRLVVVNAVDAAERGAEVRTRTQLVNADRRAGYWMAMLRDATGDHAVRAKVLVNAAGPWVGALFDRLGGVRPRRRVRLVKGSHIVLPRLYAGEHAYVIQNPDRRVVFAIPFENDFTLIGTTDSMWHGPPGKVSIEPHETEYLLETVSRTFTQPVSSSDICWAFSGIRPLYDDGATSASTITRDYALDLDDGGAALLTIFGGKITTYRRLAEHAMQRLAHLFPDLKPPWTDRIALPGGALVGGFEAYCASLIARFPALPAPFLKRLAGSYGNRTERLLGDARNMAELGDLFGADLTAREADYLIAQEWARSAEDILFRRSKLGLRVSQSEAASLEAYVQSRLAVSGLPGRPDHAV